MRARAPASSRTYCITRSITSSRRAAFDSRSSRRPGGGGAGGGRWSALPMATPAGGESGGGADPPYAAPLAADARAVVKDASLGVSARVLGERLAHRRYLATFDRLVRFTRPGLAPGGAAAAAATSAAPTAKQAGQDGEDQQDEHHHDVSYDVIGHPRCEFRFAVVFPYHPPAAAGDCGGGGGAGGSNKNEDEGEVTLVREYAHGPHRFVYTLPSGQYERAKHGGGEGSGGEGGGGGSLEEQEAARDLLATARAELEEEALLEGGEWHRLLPAGHPGIPEVKWCANAFEPFLCVGPTPHPAPAARDGEEEAAGIEAVRVPLCEFRRLAASGEMLLPSVATGWMAIEKLRELGLVK